jgi:quinol monooxygenase YgiN
MAEIVIAAYRPKPGQEDALRDLLRDHVPFLRREGLVTDRVPILGRAKDGTYVEVFEWADGGIARAHENPAVLALWHRWAEACEYVALKDLAEAQSLFAGLEPVTL